MSATNYTMLDAAARETPVEATRIIGITVCKAKNSRALVSLCRY